ncbi:MAG: hypothetical protein NT062_16640 [Proteobacteria bacterium]|nr:hypothetical protein [Pseudomonadota bacterium]
MNRLSHSLLVLALSGCDDAPPAGNPRTLWIAPDGSETQVKLVDTEPAPF